MQIDGTTIGGQRCYLIAELGHNHGGSVETATRMIEAASEAGADAVKFQIRHNDTLYTKELLDSPYNSENSYGPTYGAHRKALELSVEDLKELKDVAELAGVTMFATAFDKWAVDVCENLGFPAIKIASGCLTDTPLIRYAAQAAPLIISTGGGTDAQIRNALDAAWTGQDPALLQCTASYPCAYEELDLGVIQAWTEVANGRDCTKGRGFIPGASLHCNGIAMAVAAYCMGARVLEMHFTLDRTMKGTDHAFSLEPQGLRKLVRDIRRTEVALGRVKRTHDSELAPLRKMSKSARWARDIREDMHAREDDMVFQSPAAGLTPHEAVGLAASHRLTRSVVKGGLVERGDFEL